MCTHMCMHTQVTKVNYIKKLGIHLTGFSLSLMKPAFPSIISLSGISLSPVPQPPVCPGEPAVHTAAKTTLQSHKSDIATPLPKHTRMKADHCVV